MVVLDQSQLRQGREELSVSLVVGVRQAFVDRWVDASDHPCRPVVGRLFQHRGQVVERCGANAQEDAGVLEAHPGTYPELAVAAVGKEPWGRAVRPRNAVEGGIARWGDDEHRIGFLAAGQPREVGSRPEAVVGVVGPDLQSTRGDHQPVARKACRQLRTSPGVKGCRRGRFVDQSARRCPGRRHELHQGRRRHRPFRGASLLAGCPVGRFVGHPPSLTPPVPGVDHDPRSQMPRHRHPTSPDAQATFGSRAAARRRTRPNPNGKSGAPSRKPSPGFSAMVHESKVPLPSSVKR